jgi:hypothetical protein
LQQTNQSVRTCRAGKSALLIAANRSRLPAAPSRIITRQFQANPLLGRNGDRLAIDELAQYLDFQITQFELHAGAQQCWQGCVLTALLSQGASAWMLEGPPESKSDSLERFVESVSSRRSGRGQNRRTSQKAAQAAIWPLPFSSQAATSRPGMRNAHMADPRERSARLLVRALHYATDGEARWWVLPTNLNNMTKDAIAVAVERGWMLDRGDSVCLTEAGRDLVKNP